MEHVMISFSNNGLATNFLNEEDLRKKCPMAFMTEPTNPDVSTLYVPANTKTVIDDMAKLGWFPVEARQQRRRTEGGKYSFHMVAFQNPNVKMTKDVDGETVVDCYPRIILTNSHDGQHAFKFMVGLYRVVCSNGLVIATDSFADLSIRHIYYTFEELRDLTTKIIDELPSQIEHMNLMRRTVLSLNLKRKLATDAFKIRRGIPENVPFVLPFDVADEILRPLRDDDCGDDLWTVFNVIQEKMINGGFKYTADPKKNPRKVRKITSVAKDLIVNRKLFGIAESYINVPQE